MTEKIPHEKPSRRTRPAKDPLSREVIVSTSLEILEREGLAKLSLRRVAAALDTGAASLYVYVDNLSELHALMLDKALSTVESPAAEVGTWQERLKLYLLSYFQVLADRPGLAHLAMSTIATGPNSLRIWESLLGLLKEGGIEDYRAAWGVNVLMLHVTAIVSEQDNWRSAEGVFERVQNTLMAVTTEQFPHITAHREALLSGDGDTRVNWALDAIIEGVAGKHRLPLASAEVTRSFESKS